GEPRALGRCAPRGLALQLMVGELIWDRHQDIVPCYFGMSPRMRTLVTPAVGNVRSL
ncbi:MAG: hypothetical protein ACI9K5_000952, partial [Gammaproteobacteria bacterium]